MKVIRTVVIFLVVIQASLAMSRDLFGYLPLEPGLAWEYSAIGNNTWSRMVEGEQIIIGRSAMRVFNFQLGPEYEHLFYQFWSQDEEGNVFLHGFNVPDSGPHRYYEPPILWVDAQAEPGDSWTWYCAVYSDPEGTQFDEYRSGTRSCTESRDVTVPAGTFFSYAFASQNDKGAAQVASHRLSLDGSLLIDQPGVRHPKTWFSWGVGVIWSSIHVNGWTYLGLTDWNGPVSIERRTWSDLKAHFR